MQMTEVPSASMSSMYCARTSWLNLESKALALVGYAETNPELKQIRDTGSIFPES